MELTCDPSHLLINNSDSSPNDGLFCSSPPTDISIDVALTFDIVNSNLASIFPPSPLLSFGDQCGDIFTDKMIGAEEGEESIRNSHKRPHYTVEADEVKEEVKRHRRANSIPAGKRATVKHPKPARPQSIAAKKRRERISQKLRILQNLVPNCEKADLVTMLERAISYVKFLQSQVNILKADELWPSPGLKELLM